MLTTEVGQHYFLLPRSHGYLCVFCQDLFPVVCLAVEYAFRLGIVVQLERVFADAALETEFVVDFSTGFHSLRCIDGLSTRVTLLRLWSLERHDRRSC